MQGIEGALTALRLAIHNEISGQRFYSDAALFCIDPWAKEIFANLVQEEEGHTRLLLAEYQALTTRGRWLEPQRAMEQGADVDITRFTFPDQDPATELFPSQQPASAVVDRRMDDLEALAFGIQMERRAIELYGQSGREATDAAARQAYSFLLKEETRHYEQLKAHWEKLAGRTFQDRPTSS